MIIVADTSPINYLVLIGTIDILKELFGCVIIPQAVLGELQHEKTPTEVKAWINTCPDWLEVRQGGLSFLAPQRELGDGEREVIALAVELNTDAVLMDDRDGTQEARRNNITIFGTFALLDKAAERALLDLPTALARLAQTTFRLPPAAVVAAILERDAKRKQAEQA
jgi:predicted nucleic acid-binding protein